MTPLNNFHTHTNVENKGITCFWIKEERGWWKRSGIQIWNKLLVHNKFWNYHFRNYQLLKGLKHMWIYVFPSLVWVASNLLERSALASPRVLLVSITSFSSVSKPLQVDLSCSSRSALPSNQVTSSCMHERKCFLNILVS